MKSFTVYTITNENPKQETNVGIDDTKLSILNLRKQMRKIDMKY